MYSKMISSLTSLGLKIANIAENFTLPANVINFPAIAQPSHAWNNKESILLQE